MSRLHAVVLLASALPIGIATAGDEAGALHPDPKVVEALPVDFRREPSWREPGDCGPLALYLLMRLSGRDVSVQEVKRVVPYDAERGCSLAGLLRGAQRLGYAAEIRFVTPAELPHLRYPLIAHGYGSLERGTGHFTLIVGHSEREREYSIVDTTFETFRTQTEDSLLRETSGYVLIPVSPEAAWERAGGWVLALLGGALALAVAWPRRRRPDRPASLLEAVSPGMAAMGPRRMG